MRTALPVVLTPTRTELGLRCYRRHAVTDILEMGLYKSPAAQYGTVIHAGAATWWQSNDTAKVAEVIEREWYEQAIESEKYSLEQAQRAMQMYTNDAQLAGPLTGLGNVKIVTVEERFEVELAGYTMSFQNDRVLSLGQRVILGDTKTTSRPDAKWRTSWQHSLQMKLYRAGLIKLYDREVDIFIEGVDKNVKPKLHYVLLPQWSPAILAEAEEQFARIASKDDALIRAATGLDGKLNLANLQWAALTQTQFNDEDCSSYGMICPLRPLCDAEPEDRVGMLQADYKHIEQDY